MMISKYMPNYKNAHGDNIKNTDITIQGPTTMLTQHNIYGLFKGHFLFQDGAQTSGFVSSEAELHNCWDQLEFSTIIFTPHQQRCHQYNSNSNREDSYIQIIILVIILSCSISLADYNHTKPCLFLIIKRSIHPLLNKNKTTKVMKQNKPNFQKSLMPILMQTQKKKDMGCQGFSGGKRASHLGKNTKNKRTPRPQFSKKNPTRIQIQTHKKTNTWGAMDSSAGETHPIINRH